MDNMRELKGTFTCRCGWILEVRAGDSDDLIQRIIEAHRASRRHLIATPVGGR
jgi:hypothetical protein